MRQGPRFPFAGAVKCGYVTAVKLSVKTDYAARAVLELSAHSVDGPTLKVDDLAMVVGTSPNYLVQILIELKAAGLVSSVRGKQGGYRLAKIPGEITLGDVWRAVDGEIFDSPALSDDKCAPVLREAWKGLKDTVNIAADELTFAQLLEASGRDQEMYHI